MIQAFNHIFTTRPGRELKYRLTFLPADLPTASDLLMPSAPVELREIKEGVYVSGAKWERVASRSRPSTLRKGNTNRTTARTKMNADCLDPCAYLRIKCTGGVRTLNGMLYLVDLAGSERVKKSGVEARPLTRPGDRSRRSGAASRCRLQ